MFFETFLPMSKNPHTAGTALEESPHGVESFDKNRAKIQFSRVRSAAEPSICPNEMLPQTVYALLYDQAGQVLLIRRRNATLLSLPGGKVRPGTESLDELLSTYCQRQVGVAPDFDVKLETFTLAGQTVAVGFAEIPHARAGARGRTEAAFWLHPEKLPAEVDPIARYAVAMEKQRLGQKAASAPRFSFIGHTFR